MIKKLIDDMMDSDELLMCAMIKERSGSMLFKLRFKDEKDPTNVCSLGEATINSDVHFRRKSQKQCMREIKRVDEHRDTDISSRTRSKTEVPRSDLCSKTFVADSTNPESVFHEVASPEIYIASPNSTCEELQCVSAFSSPEPMHAIVDTVTDIPFHRVDSLPESHSASDFYVETVTLPKLPAAPELSPEVWNEHSTVLENTLACKNADPIDDIPQSPSSSDADMGIPPVLSSCDDFEARFLARLENGLGNINRDMEEAFKDLSASTSRMCRSGTSLTKSSKKKKKKSQTPNT